MPAPQPACWLNVARKHPDDTVWEYSLDRQRLQESILQARPSMPRFVEVAKQSQIPENGIIGVEIEGRCLALAKLKGEVYALDDTCPHESGPLSEGQIIGDDIECPWHRSCFNIKTGHVTRDPAMEGVATYPVRITGDVVEVEL